MASFSSEDSSAIGSFVRERRKAAQLTQAALAELAGVGERFVREVEQGKKTLRLDALNAVLAVFGKRVGIEDLPRGPKGRAILREDIESGEAATTSPGKRTR